MKKTALIIEDNDNNLALICYILEQANFNTRSVTTGLEGVKQALTMPPDFIILDIQLPDINGLEVLRRIRAHHLGKTLPIIAMTSYAMSGDKEQLLAAGCTSYIEKPIDPMQVVDQIKAAINESDMK